MEGKASSDIQILSLGFAVLGCYVGCRAQGFRGQLEYLVILRFLACGVGGVTVLKRRLLEVYQGCVTWRSMVLITYLVTVVITQLYLG